MIIVTGAVIARQETREALLAASLAHVRRSRAEPGCISHGVYIDAEAPLRLFFFEQWADRAALKTHFAAPGSAEFMGKVRALAASSTRIATFDVSSPPPSLATTGSAPPSAPA